ncbi:hypothetical protein D3C84_992800 [compost metagenome]
MLALLATDQLAGRATAAAALGAGLGLEIAAQLQADFAAQQWPARVAQPQAAVALEVDIDQATGHQLTEQRTPLGFAAGLADTEHGKLFVTEVADFVVLLAQ